MESIIQPDAKVCFLCGRNGNGDSLEKHHVFFGQNRQHSEDDGLTVYLCGIAHHRCGKYAAHQNAEINRYLKREAQRAWEHRRVQKGETEQEARWAFIRRYGKSTLD